MSPSPPAARPLRLQVYSDLHLETEAFDPQPAPDADLLVLAGDIDSRWQGYERFRGWPVPVVAVAGNHEFDGREWLAAWPALRRLGDRLGIRFLERECWTWDAPGGRRIRVLGCTRWSDYELFGAAGRARGLKAAAWFYRHMQASIGGAPLDAHAVREIGLADRAWLADALAGAATDAGHDATLVITHFAPSLQCGDPRFGSQPGTASFCNPDDDLLPRADLWIHGHVHSRHDRWVGDAAGRGCRVVCRARGHGPKGESEGHEALPPCIEWAPTRAPAG